MRLGTAANYNRPGRAVNGEADEPEYNPSVCPFQEIDHTADWALRVWAPSLEALFVDAAAGMYALSGARPADAPPERRRIAVSAEDTESLLVAWLQELLYFTESEGVTFSQFQIEALTPGTLRAEARGTAGARLDKAIKAVTYHNLKIEQTPRGFEVTLVFDV
jgi:SHS2 domain-containing protein